jgi:ribose transport system substrate-binding protein
MAQLNKFKWVPAVLFVGLIVAGYLYVDLFSAKSSPRIDFVLGGSGQFHKVVAMGAEDAAKRYNATLKVHVPDGTYLGQTNVLLSLDADNTDGVAVSPLSPNEQTQLLSELASRINLIIFDNDSPNSLRRCYVGTDNLKAGFLCGELVKQALPEGGEVALFVADLDRNNAVLRRRGVLAALAGVHGVENEDLPTGEPITAGSYTVVATYLDGFDIEKAKSNALDALSKHPDLRAMVGLYSYSAPMCLQALQEEGEVGNVAVIAFDDLEATMNGITDGHIVGTIVQDHYQYGYEAVRLLADLYRRNDSAVPVAGKGSIHLPCSKVTKSNVDEYKARLKNRTSRQE